MDSSWIINTPKDIHELISDFITKMRYVIYNRWSKYFLKLDRNTKEGYLELLSKLAEKNSKKDMIGIAIYMKRLLILVKEGNVYEEIGYDLICNIEEMLMPSLETLQVVEDFLNISKEALTDAEIDNLTDQQLIDLLDSYYPEVKEFTIQIIKIIEKELNTRYPDKESIKGYLSYLDDYWVKVCYREAGNSFDMISRFTSMSLTYDFINRAKIIIPEAEQLAEKIGKHSELLWYKVYRVFDGMRKRGMFREDYKNLE